MPKGTLEVGMMGTGSSARCRQRTPIWGDVQEKEMTRVLLTGKRGNTGGTGGPSSALCLWPAFKVAYGGEAERSGIIGYQGREGSTGQTGIMWRSPNVLRVSVTFITDFLPQTLRMTGSDLGGGDGQ